MAWFENEHYVVDVAARDRAADLISTTDAMEAPRTGTWTGALLFGALMLVSGAGCASGTRAVVVEPSASVGEAAPPAVPTCQGSGSYNRAANLCVSEGA